MYYGDDDPSGGKWDNLYTKTLAYLKSDSLKEGSTILNE